MNDLRVDFEKEWNKFIDKVPKEALPTITALEPYFLDFYAKGQMRALEDIHKRIKEQ